MKIKAFGAGGHRKLFIPNFYAGQCTEQHLSASLAGKVVVIAKDVETGEKQ